MSGIIRDPTVREPNPVGGFFTGRYWLGVAAGKIGLLARGLKVCVIHVWDRFVVLVAPLWEEEEEGVDVILRRLEETPYGFIIMAFSFLNMKSQSVPGFPFTTCPTASTVSVASFLASVLASAVERYIYALGFDQSGCFAIVARLASVACKWFLFASLVCLLFL